MALMDFCTEELADKGTVIDIYAPTGAPLNVRVCMLGTDSEEYEKTSDKISKRNLEHAKRKGDFTAGMEPEKVKANLIEKMAACFLYWEEQQKDGTWRREVEFSPGELLPSTKEAFKNVISRRGFYWFKSQIQTGMDDVTRFLPTAQKPSAPTLPTDLSTAQ